MHNIIFNPTAYPCMVIGITDQDETVIVHRKSWQVEIAGHFDYLGQPFKAGDFSCCPYPHHLGLYPIIIISNNLI